MKTWFITQICNLASCNNLSSKLYNRNTCNLADIWNCTAWTWINFNYIYLVVVYNKLNVNKTLNVKWPCKLSSIINYHICNFFWYWLSWIYWNTITWVNTCSFNMLHNTRNKNIFAITYSINFNFLTHKILIYKDWVVLLNSVNNSHILNNIFIRYSNLHTLTT